MPQLLVSVEQGLSEEQYELAKKFLEEKGGEVLNVFMREGVAPGFEVKFPDDVVSTLDKQDVPHFVDIENALGDVKTQ